MVAGNTAGLVEGADVAGEVCGVRLGALVAVQAVSTNASTVANAAEIESGLRMCQPYLSQRWR